MIEIRGLSRIYNTKAGTVKALDNVNLELESTGMVFILGKSGSGKSTLLNVLGGLDKYDSGEIIIKGKSSKDFSGSDFDSYRNTFIGFIFQDYNILQEFTVAKNIGLALELQGKKATPQAIDAIVSSVDMQGYANRKPSTLSGGQKQRVAIARALIKEPEIIMADEPTGALDSNTGKQVFDTLKKLSKEKLVLVVSHDRENAEYYADRIIELKDGQVISDVKKYLAPPQSASSGINIVGNKIVTIKAGHTLTPDDTQLLNSFLSAAKEDVIISVDGKSNEQFKKLARIDSSGNKESFANTRRDKLNIKQYDPKQFKLIRSKLPWGDSFKIGASGLKAKPIRLIFTIFLCAIAFTLFGLADTMGSYNKINASIASIKEANIDFASVTKEVKREDDEWTSWGNTTKLKQEDVDKLNADLNGVNFNPVFSLDNNSWSNAISFSTNLHSTDDMPQGYYLQSCYGAMELNQATLDSFGFDLYGNLPANENEVVVTSYLYDHFVKAGYRTQGSNSKVEITNKDHLINKIISFNTSGASYNLKVVGILDTNFDDSRYTTLKETQNQGGGIGDYMMMQEFSNLMQYSYHALLFVEQGYYEAHKSASEFLLMGKNSYLGIYVSNNRPNYQTQNWERDVYIDALGRLSDVDSSKIIWKDGAKTTLAQNEIVMGIGALNNLVMNTVDGEMRFDSYSLLYQARNEIEQDLYDYDNTSGLTTFQKLCADDTFALLFPYAGLYSTFLVNPENGYALQNQYSDIIWQTQEYDVYPEFVAAFPTYADYVSALGSDSGFYSNPFEPTRTGASYYMPLLNDMLNYLFADDDCTSAFISYNVNYEYFSAFDSQKYSIVGVFLDTDRRAALMSDDFYDMMKEGSGGDFNFAISVMPSSDSNIRALVEYTYTDGITQRYRLNNQISSALSMVNSMIETLATVFFWVGVGFAVFASLMMLNFISTSIAYKKRDIGILRAVGARGSDVFGIFFNEALLITLINFAIALAATITVCIVLNSVLRQEVGLMIVLLTFGIRQIALMLGVSVAVAFLSSFLPVNRISRMRPIEAIKQY